MPIVMKITLLLLLFGGVWADGQNMITSPQPTSTIREAKNLDSTTYIHTTTRDSEKTDQIGTTHYTTSEVPTPGTFTTISSGPPVSKPTISQEVSTKESPTIQETSTETSNLAVSATPTPGLPGMTGGTRAASYLDTSNGTIGSTVTMTTGPLEASNGTIESTVTMTTGPLQDSSWINGTTGPSVIISNSLETSNRTSGPPIIMSTSTVKISKGATGFPVSMATSSLKTPKGTSGSPISRVKISTISTPEPPKNTGSGSSPSSDQGANNTLLVAVFVALLVVIVLLVLLLLWRQRQKRRTGALTLSGGGGKRNGVIDAWAGPARVSDEEAAVTTTGVSGGGDKGSGVPDGEGSSRRPTLTTFFGRRKSRQGSLALEELKAGSAASLKGEEEPLVGSEDGALEAPSSDEPEAGKPEVL